MNESAEFPDGEGEISAIEKGGSYYRSKTRARSELRLSTLRTLVPRTANILLEPGVIG
jgi:hypothetical protein